ncbi:MAG: uracil-DNA glycosylase [Dissulfurimicrobium sp.]|uniref:uracil-DNA glycosylase n=1 Tax=Dissulfurimicrobium TaxID=1769732 RepID=UPI001EDC0279|nr:uracil-DNA glycosylase [Dissulfurimicrobium hydrothermale]UKL13219.1 uracil-DNA glycosylase [Dissulfurimicrobium hydrothermale]
MTFDKFTDFIHDIINWIRFQRELGTEVVERTRHINAFLGGSADCLHNFQNGKWDATVPATKISLPKGEAGLLEVKDLLGDCKRCGLHKTRKGIVFGEGPGDARLLIVGEAPGREEDIEGRPFVGPSGKLLAKMLKAIDIERSDTYITSVIKCRPPANRTPKPGEIASCIPFLALQICAVSPKLILALGQIAAQWLLNVRKPLHELRGVLYSLPDLPVSSMRIDRPNDILDIKVVVTYHPAYILRLAGDRQKSVKLDVWKDLQMLQHEYKQG